MKFIVPLGILVRAAIHEAVVLDLRRGQVLGKMRGTIKTRSLQHRGKAA